MKTIKLREVGELTPAEVNKYEQLKRELSDQLEILTGAFARVGKILKTINEERLYRAEYTTFEEFCKDQLQKGRSYVYRLIGAYEVVCELMKEGVRNKELPQSERLCRELAEYPKAERARILRRSRELALKEGREEPDSIHVRQAAGELSPEGKARLIRALVDKLQAMERSLPAAISWEELEPEKALQIKGLLVSLARRAHDLVKAGRPPKKVKEQSAGGTRAATSS